MPLYEFECPQCGARFEDIVRNADAVDEVACPQCGRPRPERLLSTPARAVSSGSSGGTWSGGGCGSRGGFS